MNSKARRCDRLRIDEFLRSDQIHTADAELISHLDSCSDCRNYMEQQAADSESWTRAANLLQEREFDVASSMEYSAGAIDFLRVSIPTAIQNFLESLTPSENPQRLGRLDGYEITGVIGAGAMGVVLKAIDPALDRIVALKVMAQHLASHATARKRFEREAKAAAAVLHPNVIPIYAVSSGGAMPYLVMAYIRGGSLQKRIDRDGALNTGEILRIGSQIAAGLAAAHDQGLVHRDIKPENIMLGEGVERVTLTDFGLARSVDDASVTQHGTIAGTPQYMSPEQARGESVEQASDLFSLGSVLYTLCTGRAPFRADSSHSVMRKIIDEEPVPIRDLNPEIPEWLCDIVAKLMAKDKAARFTSAKNVHALLESCLSHVQQPTVIKLPELVRELSRSKSTSRFPIILGVSAMAVFATFVFWFSGSLGLLVQEPAPKPTTIVAQEPANASSAEVPLTWKALLGEDVPENYPTEPLQAIDGLNKTVGSWGFAGQQLQSSEETEFEAVMQVQGGFNSDTLSLGSQPMWQITIQWPAKEPEQAWNLTLVPALNPDGMEWLLFCVSSSIKDPKVADEKQLYIGSWDPASRTLTWTPNEPTKPGIASGPDEAGKGSEFQMIIAKNGGLQIKNIQQNGTGRISGQSVARIGEYVKPSSELKMLPNGYKMFFASSSEVLLVDQDNGGVAGARVDKIGCSGNLIYGLITQRDRIDKPEDTPGYFWLDSTTGEIMKGMKLGDWQETLKAKGVEEVLLLAPERVGPRS
ncbi:MAG: serine/threonine protein kinase [Planctomycetaceae bacterium]|nr:serine/threonine protein kinase [Planctomycetaceae bacterium]